MLEPERSMMPSESSQPFWRDELEYQSTKFKPSKMADTMVKAIGVFMVLAIFGITFGLTFQVSHLWALGVVIYFVVVFGTALISGMKQRKKQQDAQQDITKIQERAAEIAGASLMGSAIHSAGNPRLEREQKIVLALTASSLDFYAYDNATPLDSIPLKHIVAIHTVVYDDDQIPHTDIVDNTAQALQISVKYGETSYDILLRNMRKVHPIDWYHAIQKARLIAGVK